MAVFGRSGCRSGRWPPAGVPATLSRCETSWRRSIVSKSCWLTVTPTTPRPGLPAISRCPGQPASSSGSSGVVPLHFSRDAIQIRKEAPFVHADQVELVAKARRLSRGDNEFGKGRAETVSLEETVKRHSLVRAQGECGGLGDDARVERWWLEHAGKRFGLGGP